MLKVVITPELPPQPALPVPPPPKATPIKLPLLISRLPVILTLPLTFKLFVLSVFVPIPILPLLSIINLCVLDVPNIKDPLGFKFEK